MVRINGHDIGPHMWECPNCGQINLNVDWCQKCGFWPEEEKD